MNKSKRLFGIYFLMFMISFAGFYLTRPTSKLIFENKIYSKIVMGSQYQELKRLKTTLREKNAPSPSTTVKTNRDQQDVSKQILSFVFYLLILRGAFVFYNISRN